MYFIEKFITPILSAVLFAVFLSIYNDFGYFMAIFYFSLPLFLIAGTICSIVVEYYVERIQIKKSFNKYLISVFLYCISGVIALFVFALIQGGILEIRIQPLIVLGITPALIYCHLSLFFKYLVSRLDVVS